MLMIKKASKYELQETARWQQRTIENSQPLLSSSDHLDVGTPRSIAL